MEFTYQFSSDGGLLTIRFVGKLNLTGLLSALRRVAEDSRYQPRMHVLDDLREASIDLDLDDVDRLAEVLPKVFPATDRRVAILADQPREVAVAMLHVQRFSEVGRDAQVFSTEKAALAWLGYPAATTTQGDEETLKI